MKKDLKGKKYFINTINVEFLKIDFFSANEIRLKYERCIALLKQKAMEVFRPQFYYILIFTFYKCFLKTVFFFLFNAYKI